MTKSAKNLFHFLRQLQDAGHDPRRKEAEIWDRYGQQVAVLVLDSSGFSRVSKSHGIVHFLACLMRMREVTEPVFSRYRARHVDFHADNVMAVYDAVDDALQAALEVHEALEQAAIPLTDQEDFRVCIGIGYGELLYSETLEGYFGEEMNNASKLGEDTADPGETLLTEAAWQAADKAMTGGFEPRKVEVSGVTLNYFLHSRQEHPGS